MAGKLEIERKYELPDGFALPDLTGIGGVTAVGEPDDQRLDAVYYDTAGLHLARGRVTLRRRTGGNDAGWHLKRPAGGDRSELQLPAGNRQKTPPRAVVDQVRALTRGADLSPVARIRTHRVERALRAADGSTVALLADDTVSTESLRNGAGGAREWHELEIELVDGDAAALERLDAALRKAGARPAKSPSKLAQALGPDYPAPSAVQPRGSKSRQALAAYIAAQRDALVEHDPHVREGDAESVHKMRVATRRLRSTLRSFRPLLAGDKDGDLDRLHDEIKWVTGLLGDVRDTDVMGERLAHLVHEEPEELVLGPVAARITSLLAARAAEARRALVTGLDSERYTSLLDDIDALVARTATPENVPRKRLMARARKALRRADGRMDAARSDVEKHEARKAYKRARYAAELVAPVAGGTATKLADRVTDLQDALGDHQDAMVTGELLKQYAITAYGAGENAFTYGLLHARIDEHGRRSLEDVPKARRKVRKAARALYG
ncbi:CHAD domain-containing protein [Dactylosporangium sp. CS-047395]|uniref:CYTH and CHAD domain-containing protein n=1 Tax=Dactylosporangium sp. CS-047395 TaxID=3239936 RepID=UPI003D928A89